MDVDAERPRRVGRQFGQASGRGAGHAPSLPGRDATRSRTYAHPEYKSGPVRAYVGVRGTIGDVIAARILHTRVSLVSRRHVDFKRVCSCCCLP
ncbi:Ms4527A family Cys-rich leader peptide [Mycobacterium hubeiense]|uniref:Ms4527A family Cys-rich leader peptide n=1 Tax=Mycobacterium hubeiense TaxID=1867256 RepID=UPI003D67FCA9